MHSDGILNDLELQRIFLENNVSKAMHSDGIQNDFGTTENILKTML